jgi:cytoskeletal protein CcmA (bactofilin family)
MALTLVAAAGWAETRHGDTVVIGSNERIAEDLYVAGGNVTVDGPIDGDLIIAGGEVRVRGEVKGDLLCIAGRTALSGKVGGSVRGLGGQLTVDGDVGHDLAWAGGELTLGSQARVGRDVLTGVGRGQLLGAVGRNVGAYAGQLEADAQVIGRLAGQVSQLSLGEHARIGGDLSVATDHPLTMAPGAQVLGRTERLPWPEMARPVVGLGLVRWLRSLVGLLALAALWRLLFPGFSRRAVATLHAQPGRSLGFGALTLIVVPFGALTVGAIGAVVGGWWLGAVAFGLLLLAATLAAPLVGHFVGAWVLALFKREGSEALRQGAGLLVLTLLAAIPVLGGLVMLITACAGVGAQLLALRGRLPVQTSEPLDQLRDAIPAEPEEVGSPS